MDFYWKNDLSENTLENFKRNEIFGLTADSVITQQNKTLYVDKNNGSLRYSLIDFTKKDYGWNEAVSKINELRNKLGLPPYTFTYVMKGDQLTAQVFNEAREAINSTLPYLELKTKGIDATKGLQCADFFITTPKHRGDIINADYFNQIAEILSIEKFIDPSVTDIAKSTFVAPTPPTLSYTNRMTGVQYGSGLISTSTSHWSDIASFMIGFANDQNRSSYVSSSHSNRYIDCFLNIINHAKYGTILNMKTSKAIPGDSGWFSISPKILEWGTLGLEALGSSRDSDSKYDVKDFVGVNIIVHNEVPGLQFVANVSGDDFNCPKYRFYGDVAYASHGANVDYPVFPIGRYKSYNMSPFEYDGNLYYINKDNRIHVYDPDYKTWDTACGGQKFDFDSKIGVIKTMWVYENYLYIWPYDISSKIYRIDLDGDDNTIETLSVKLKNNYNDYYLGYMDLVIPSIEDPSKVYLSYYSEDNFRFFILDMDNMSVDAGYSSSNSSYTDYYNEFVAINNYLMGCSYVDYDKIAYDGDDLFYFFDYYDKFIKYDKEGHDTYYENQKQPDGSVITVPYIYVNNVKTYITEDEIRPIYTEYAPPEVLGYPVIIGSYVYAVTLEAEDPKLYRFSMSRKHWESLGAIPYRYY